MKTAEAFAEEAAALRNSFDLAEPLPASGSVLVKPPEGEPCRALITASRPLGAGPMRPPMAVGIELIEVDGHWLVASFRTLATQRDAFVFADPIRRAGPRGSVETVFSTLRGEVIKVENGVVTLKLTVRQENPPTGDERTFTIDEKTVVNVGAITAERKLANGQSIKTVRFRRGEITDVATGLAATVDLTDDGSRALLIQVTPGAAGGFKTP